MYPIKEVLSAVKRGYSTSADIAHVTDINKKTVSAYLTSLWQLDLIVKTGIRKPTKRGPVYQVYGVK